MFVGIFMNLSKVGYRWCCCDSKSIRYFFEQNPADFVQPGNDILFNNRNITLIDIVYIKKYIIYKYFPTTKMISNIMD